MAGWRCLAVRETINRRHSHSCKAPTKKNFRRDTNRRHARPPCSDIRQLLPTAERPCNLYRAVYPQRSSDGDDKIKMSYTYKNRRSQSMFDLIADAASAQSRAENLDMLN